MRKRIDLVVSLFREAGKSVHSMPLLLFQPIWVNSRHFDQFRALEIGNRGRDFKLLKVEVAPVDFNGSKKGNCWGLFSFLLFFEISDSDLYVCDWGRMDVGAFVDYKRRKSGDGCDAWFRRFHQRRFHAGRLISFFYRSRYYNLLCKIWNIVYVIQVESYLEEPDCGAQSLGARVSSGTPLYRTFQSSFRAILGHLLLSIESLFWSCADALKLLWNYFWFNLIKFNFERFCRGTASSPPSGSPNSVLHVRI